MSNSGMHRSLLIRAAVSVSLLWLGLAAAAPGLAGQVPVTASTAAQTAHLALLAQTQSGNAMAPGCRILSVGVVLTADGIIWQYVPTQGRWYNIDESFRLSKNETHILPLPVPVGSIQEMQTFGFICTTGGEFWLYDMGSNRWGKLPPLPARP
jgi:hypothetical protein